MKAIKSMKRLFSKTTLDTFGIDLQQRMYYEKKNLQNEYDVPIIVESIIENIKKKTIKEEGMFRISIEQKILAEHIQNINTEKDFDYSTLSIHTLCCLLKEYFRSLPEPLTTRDGCEILSKISKKSISENQKIEEIRLWLTSLPKFNFSVLKKLFNFLNLISTGEEYKKCKMSSKNLAIVFMSTINLTSSSEGQLVLILAENSNNLIECVELMINSVDYLFFEDHFEPEEDEFSVVFSSSPFEDFLVKKLNTIEQEIKDLKEELKKHSKKIEKIESKFDKFELNFDNYSKNESKEISRLKKLLFDQTMKVDELSAIVKKKNDKPKFTYNHRGEIMSKMPFH
eukprot:gene5029-8626_t